MERTYADVEHGGGYKEHLIPNLTELAQNEGEDFSDEEGLNGAYMATNTSWTAAGLVAESAGLSLNIQEGGDQNKMLSDGEKFLPHVSTLGDILKSAGYNNYFQCGSEGTYAARQSYYEQHGDYAVYDYFKASEKGWIPAGYRAWWGYEDDYLFKIAKKQIIKAAAKGEPFNYTMLTVDTHFTDGYRCADCDYEFNTQYKNVIACSDRKISEFVDWCKKQDFYKDTVIVIAGDHLSMDASVVKEAGEDYERRVYFTVINGPEYEGQTRSFTTLDIFPTILEAMEVDVEGHRLGLGTSLYSSEETLVEQMGFEKFNRLIAGKSDYYANVILSGDDRTLPLPEEKQVAATVDQKAPSAQFYMANYQAFADPGYVFNPADDPVQTPEQPAPNPAPETSSEEIQDQPESTDTPDSPSTPPSETPDQPQTPDLPTVPDVPAVPEVPTTPEPPITPDVETGME